jgi:hypothetical protein
MATKSLLCAVVRLYNAPGEKILLLLQLMFQPGLRIQIPIGSGFIRSGFNRVSGSGSGSVLYGGLGIGTCKL